LSRARGQVDSVPHLLGKRYVLRNKATNPLRVNAGLFLQPKKGREFGCQ